MKRLTSPKFIFYALVTVLAVPNVALCFTERMGILASAANVVLPCSAVWLAATFSRKPGKMTWIMFPLIFFAAFQLVLLYLFGCSIIAVDMFLNLVTTNAGEALELLDNLVPAVAIVVVIYVPVLVLASVSLRRKAVLSRDFIRSQRKIAACSTAVGLVLLIASYAADKDYRAEIELYPVNVGYNLVLAVERTNATADYPETSAGFRFGSETTHDKNQREVYVLVIGETARKADFGIYGYGRNTTPMLKAQGGLVVFTDVLTQSNTTHKSVPMLLSAASAEDYDRIYREKGIITAFKEAGFHTVFISNQMPNHSFIDIFGKEADEWVFLKEKSAEGADTKDCAMLPMVAKVLAEGRKKEFIVLHTYGSHFNYRERYPASEAFFKPDDATEAKASNRPSLVNAYDNSIRYTDKLLGSLVKELARSGATSAMLYTSDHGENIFDDSKKLFLHASPRPSWYELRIPFIVWLSSGYASAYPQEAASLYANRHKSAASSASVFHTMLGIAGIRTPFRNDSLSLASRRFTVMPRMYLNDHNRPVPVEDIVR